MPVWIGRRAAAVFVAVWALMGAYGASKEGSSHPALGVVAVAWAQALPLNASQYREPVAEEGGSFAGPSDAAEPAEPERPPITLFFGGDVNLGRTCGQRILADTSHDPFVGIERLWTHADLRVVNLESVLSDQGGETESRVSRYVFTGPPAGASVLRRAGIDVAVTANNHAWDYGQEALLSTLDSLDAEGIEHVGTGVTIERAEAPFSRNVKGTRLAIVAGTGVWNQGLLRVHPARQYVASGAADGLAVMVKAARADHDVVVAVYHGGAEYSAYPAAWSLKVAQAAMEAGADAFIAHHPHVPQGVGFIDGKPVLYSLGNLVFKPVSDSVWTRIGLLAELRFGQASNPELSLCPIFVGEYLPQAMDAPRHRARVLEVRSYLMGLSRWIGPTRFEEPDARGCFVVRPG